MAESFKWENSCPILSRRSIIRKYLVEGYTIKAALIAIGKCVDTRCMKCGWMNINPHTGLIPTEVNHIDGNNCNCLPSNVEILCPNCHALTPTHKGANQERSKHNRKMLR